MDTSTWNQGEISFYLTIRPAANGKSDVVLRLYRGGRLASETIISTVRDSRARMILLMSRMQLFRLGYDEHVLTIPHVSSFEIESN